MKSPYVGTLPVNEPVTASFPGFVQRNSPKENGRTLFIVALGRPTGEIEAKMWDNVAEVMDTFERDEFLKVKGMVQVYQNRSQFTIHKLRRLEEHEVDFADYFPSSERDPEEMFAELRGHRERVHESASESAAEFGAGRCAIGSDVQNGASGEDDSSCLSRRLAGACAFVMPLAV